MQYKQQIRIMPNVKFGAVSENGYIFLERRGCSTTLHCGLPDKFYLEQSIHQVHIHVKGMPDIGEQFHGEHAMPEALARINEKFGTEYMLAGATHGYCFTKPTYEYEKNDIFLSPVRYETGSGTIRHVPTNYCLVAFDNEEFSKPILDMDGATVPYRGAIEKALKVGFHPCDTQKGDDYCKRRLAWLAGRFLLEQATDPVVVAVLANDIETSVRL